MSPFTICPHCGFHEASDETCSRCGIVFRKFYARQETPARRLDSVLREDEVIAEFQRRRREWRNGSGFIFLVLVLLLLGPEVFHWDIFHSAWVWIIVVVGVLARVLVDSQYRCPVCDAKMSSDWRNYTYTDPVACPECGARLKRLSDVRKSST